MVAILSVLNITDVISVNIFFIVAAYMNRLNEPRVSRGWVCEFTLHRSLHIPVTVAPSPTK